MYQTLHIILAMHRIHAFLRIALSNKNNMMLKTNLSNTLSSDDQPETQEYCKLIIEGLQISFIIIYLKNPLCWVD